MKTIRYGIEYLGLRAGLFLVDTLPLAAATGLARGIADLWFRIDASRRKVACANILRSRVASTPAQARSLARASFRHFAVLIVESLKSDRLFTADNWRERVALDIPASSMDLLQKPGQGVILISGHLGNWEIAAQLLSFLKPVAGVTRRMNNPYTDRLMQRRKPRNGFRLLPKHDAGPGRFLSVLKEGSILALLADQYPRDKGIPIDFFGVPALTHRSPALLHLVTHAPLIFGYCLRTGPLQYRLKALDPIVRRPTGNRDADVRAILEQIQAALEAAIREAPDQYLWAHRRWRDPKAKIAAGTTSDTGLPESGS